MMDTNSRSNGGTLLKNSDDFDEDQDMATVPTAPATAQPPKREQYWQEERHQGERYDAVVDDNNGLIRHIHASPQSPRCHEGSAGIQVDLHDPSGSNQLSGNSPASPNGLPSPASSGSSPPAATGGKRRKGPATTFPVLLLRLLENAGESEAISWQPDGRSFMIKDKDAFVSRVMPKYFRSKRFSSFQRQLALYGFRFVLLKRTGSTHYGSYHHHIFRRGMPVELCDSLTREPRKFLNRTALFTSLAPSSGTAGAASQSPKTRDSLVPSTGGGTRIAASSQQMSLLLLQAQQASNDLPVVGIQGMSTVSGNTAVLQPNFHVEATTVPPLYNVQLPTTHLNQQLPFACQTYAGSMRAPDSVSAMAVANNPGDNSSSIYASAPVAASPVKPSMSATTPLLRPLTSQQQAAQEGTSFSTTIALAANQFFPTKADTMLMGSILMGDDSGECRSTAVRENQPIRDNERKVSEGATSNPPTFQARGGRVSNANTKDDGLQPGLVMENSNGRPAEVNTKAATPSAGTESVESQVLCGFHCGNPCGDSKEHELSNHPYQELAMNFAEVRAMALFLSDVDLRDGL